MTNDVQQLRAALKTKKTGGPNLRYQDPALRAQIAKVTAGLLASGMSWWGAAKKVGISFAALKKICKPLETTTIGKTNGHATNGHARSNGHPHLTIRTAKGDRVDGLLGGGPLALVTKDGHRVEGLSVETLARLLARL